MIEALTVVASSPATAPGSVLPAGPGGASAFALAVSAGFRGTQDEWLASLVGGKGPHGDDAYQVAVAAGFPGTRSAWLASLEGKPGTTTAQGLTDVVPELKLVLQSEDLPAARTALGLDAFSTLAALRALVSGETPEGFPPRRGQFVAAIEASGAGRVALLTSSVPSDPSDPIARAWAHTIFVTTTSTLANFAKMTLGLSDAELDAVISAARTIEE